MAIYKRGREFELGTTEYKSSKRPERDSNLGPPDGESDALTTRPRCLPNSNIRQFHVVVVQKRQRNVQESDMHLQRCCFAY